MFGVAEALRFVADELCFDCVIDAVDVQVEEEEVHDVDEEVDEEGRTTEANPVQQQQHYSDNIF